MKVFYSWQSDTPTKVGHSFIREALDEAIKIITDEMSLDEAQRDAFQIDHDTKGVLGSPPVTDTILNKIIEADIFVADVTLTGHAFEKKRLINSNVAYELGYAHAQLSDQALLKVMNVHYGTPDYLPFDLQHRRWPVPFNLPPDATREQRRTEKKKLSKDLSKILRGYVGNLPSKTEYQPIPSSYNPAVYWEKNQILVDDSTLNKKLSYQNDIPLIYLHMWPDKNLEDLKGVQLSGQGMPTLYPLIRSSVRSRCRNKYGLISYNTHNEQDVTSSTQVFKNREIWGIDSYSVSKKLRGDKEFIPTQLVEEGIRKSLNNYLDCAKNTLNYTRVVHIRFGIVGAAGLSLAVPYDHFWEDTIGKIFEDLSITLSIDSEDEESITEALLTIYELIFDAAGQERPQNLYDFPKKYRG